LFRELSGGDIAAWTSLVVTAVGLLIAWITYLNQRGRQGLEYLVLSNQPLVNRRVAPDLDVSFRDQPVRDPSLLIVRMVSTGDKAIPASAYETPLAFALSGAQSVVTASVSATRPPDLTVQLTWERNKVFIQPLLLNVGDFIELQVLAAGRAHSIDLEVRIADVQPRRRTSLPYPPGSGPEGQMLGFDKFMWAFGPVSLFGILLAAMWTNDARPLAFAGWASAAAVLLFVLFPMRVSTLVRRRRNWRP
jgi:hypothetical protein